MPSGVIEKKLAEAQSKRSKKRKRIFSYGGLTVFAGLLIAALVYLIVELDRARTQLQQAGTPGSGSDPQPQPVTNAGDTIALPSNGAAQITQLPESSTTDTDDDQVFRQQFLQQLAQYESEVEPKIAEIRLSRWDGEKHAELQRLKADAIEAFSKGDYLAAREGVGRARALVDEAAAEYIRRLAAAKGEARAAFADDRAPQAEKAVGEALLLRPDDPDMLALQKRVAVLPEVLDLLRQVGVARNENRLEKEAAALEKVLAVDPSRTALRARLGKLQAQLKSQLNRQRFASAVRNAEDALDSGDLGAAEGQIALAKTVFPDDASLPPLQIRLLRARTQRAFAAQTTLGADARARDDWPAAVAHFARARQLKPADKIAVENHDLAQRVVGATQKIRRILDQERRLGDQKVLESTAAYLQETEAAAEVSAELQKIHGELTRKVALYGIEVEVIVVSDNKTYVIVRGQGRVGATARRTIRLRPGRRVFEGTRAGYRSKLVTVDLAPGAPAVEVTIICDEKI